MANFDPAFDKMIRNEGGFKLTNIEGDRGGQTYAGIARNVHPGWPGWRFVDAGDLTQVELTQSVRDFYRREFWDRIGGDAITHQTIAETLFDFAVNAGSGTAAKLAQIVVGWCRMAASVPRRWPRSTVASLNCSRSSTRWPRCRGMLKSATATGRRASSCWAGSTAR